MREFKLQIVTPDGLVFDGTAESVMVRTASGDIEIMAGHEDYFASLGTGRARLKSGGLARDASASGGFISVLRGEVKLALTTFEFADEIDLVRAESARARAEEQIKNASDDKALTLAKAKLARAINRINVAKTR